MRCVRWLTAWRMTRSKRDDRTRSSMEKDGTDDIDMAEAAWLQG